MAGGILDLAAKGEEDLYITGNPEITFFKTVYRRHTNFSRVEYDLNFNTCLDFGKESLCRIKRWGDLLHRLFIVIQLPEIDIVFRSLTVGEVQNLLAEFDIDWKTNKNPEAKFTESDFNEVEQLIYAKTAQLQNEINIFNNMLTELKVGGDFYPTTWRNSNPDISNDPPIPSQASKKYLDDVIRNFFKYDKLDLQYNVIDSHNKDIANNPLPLANSTAIQNYMFERYLDYAISNDNDPNTFNDENIRFYYNTDTANYIISGGLNQIDSSTVFRGGITNAYGNIPFQHLDAYFIFDSTLQNNQTDILNVADIDNLKIILLDNIQFGLIKNVQLLSNIYNSLNNDTKFTFYRKLPVLSPQVNYNKGTSFSSYSLIPNPPDQLNDRFTEKFTLTPLPNEPSDVNHPFSQFVQDIVNTFHTDNRSLFRLSKFLSYFDDLDLWRRTDVITNPNTPPLTGSPLNYFLNNIWFMTTEDIPNSTNIFLFQNPTVINLLSVNTKNRLINDLLAIKPDIISQITPFITLQDNYDTISALETSVKTASGINGDLLVSAIFRPNAHLEFNGQRFYIPDYIIERYLNVINNFDPGAQDANNWNNNVKQRLVQIYNNFRGSESTLPTYNNYINQNRNISSSTTLWINNVGVSKFIFSDTVSSIFYHIFKNIVGNYNNLYNTNLLGFDTYEQKVGSELRTYIDQIANTSFNYIYDPENPIPYDYYLNSLDYEGDLPGNPGDPPNSIGLYLIAKEQILTNQFQKYSNNRLLLNARDIIISRSRYYFEQFDTVVDLITGIIEGNFDAYRHEFHPDPGSDIVLITQNNIKNNPDEYTNPANNAMDIIFRIRDIFSQFVTAVSNPYNSQTDPNKKSLWDNKTGSFDSVQELIKYNTIFDFLYPDEPGTTDGAQILFTFLTLIDSKYNGFVSESDVYEYMTDIVLQNSLLKDFPTLIGSTYQETNSNLISYLEQRITENEQDIAGLLGTPETPGLLNVLQRSLNAGTPAQFAWIKRIGHYLFECITLKIGDQVIDKHPGEWLELWHSLTKRIRKEKGYKRLIGDVAELTTFNNEKKNTYELIIPLQFFFNKFLSQSLPMVSMLHTDVTIGVKVKELEQVAYFDPFTEFRTKPRIKCKLLCEYIYVDAEERERLAKSKLEYLIDVVQYNGDNYITSNTTNEDNIAETRLFFRNPCKEFVWVIQNSNFINGKLPNGERRYDLYSTDIESTINPAEAAEIQFSSRERENMKDIIFYEQVKPREVHNASPQTGINIYPMSLFIESEQPFGAANLSRLDDVVIRTKLKQFVVDDMKSNNAICRWGIYGLTYQVLRIISGMTGLVFWE